MLRDFAEADRAAFLAYPADPGDHAAYGPDDASPEHASGLFETFRAWASERPPLNVQLAIVQRAEPHAPIGSCGLRRRGAEPGEAAFGVELAPEVWGRYGFAVEVGRALLGFGFDRLRLSAITSSTVSANDRVQRLAEWFGAEVVTVHAGAAWMARRGWTRVDWRVPRDQWAARYP